MEYNLIFETLSDGSKELTHLIDNIDILKDFLVLVNRIDALPETNRRLDSISPYQAVAKGLPLQQIERYFLAFFGAPIKRAGAPVKMKLKLNPSVKHLGGIRREQAFFIRKTKLGQFYGAIWPWVRKPEFQTIHLGYYSKSMTNEDFHKLESLIKQSTHERMVSDIDAGVGGVIHGISLPAFLQMSELETTTATLEIKSGAKTGSLCLKEGMLIDGKTGPLTGKEAAYEIISWDDVSITINKADPAKQNVIMEPLMHILMESLKIKDEKRDAAGKTDTTETHAQDTNKIEAVPDKYDSLREDLSETLPSPKEQPAKKTWIKLFILSAVVFLSLAAGIYFIPRQIEANRIKKAYHTLLENLNRLESYKEKEISIRLFINAHKDTEYSKKASEKLRLIRETMDDQLYKDIITTVEALPLTIDYDATSDEGKTGRTTYEGMIAKTLYDEKRARALYEDYLVQFPKGRHVQEIKDRIAKIPEKLEDALYKQLLSTEWDDIGKKIAAYKGFIISHPEGKHRDEAEAVLVNILEHHFSKIKENINDCDEKKQWVPCLEACDRFLSFFDNTYRTDAVLNIKKSLQEKQDLVDLKQRAKDKADDYEAVKDLYQNYLTSHPDAAMKDSIKDEISRLQALMDERDSWQQVLDSSQNSEKDIAAKIDELNHFVELNPTSQYIVQAKTLLENLQKEKKQIEEKRRAEKIQELERQRLMMEAKRQQMRKNRLSGEIAKVVSSFPAAGGRYLNNGNGTFTDSKTGLIWCVLNSDITEGKCLDYQTARQYVKELTTGGHTDWRLPTFSELSGLYKHEPFFPSSGQKQFWTSETIVKGYHEMAGVVTSKKEAIFKRNYILTDDCATVHAVRGKN